MKKYIATSNRNIIFAPALEEPSEKRINNQGSGTLQINVICQLELDYRDTEKKENHFTG